MGNDKHRNTKENGRAKIPLKRIVTCWFGKTTNRYKLLIIICLLVVIAIESQDHGLLVGSVIVVSSVIVAVTFVIPFCKWADRGR